MMQRHTQWQEHLSPLIQQLMSAQPRNDDSNSATTTTIPTKSTEEETAKPIEKKKSQQQQTHSTHLPQWLSDIYSDVWLYKLQHNENSNMLEMSELITRPIDPESPLWYMLPMNKKSNIDNNEYRRQMWIAIRLELYKTLNKLSSKRKVNLYAYHNVAVLSFHIGNREESFDLMNMLIENVFNTSFLKTMAYFYIQSNQLLDAAVVLYHLLTNEEEVEQEVDYHSLYLSMRLLTKQMEETNSTTTDLLLFRNCLMRCLCKNKPNHQLYKLWAEEWQKENPELQDEESIEPQEAVSDVIQLLKQMLGTEYDSDEHEQQQHSSTKEVVPAASPVSVRNQNTSWVQQSFRYIQSIFSDYRTILRLIGTIISIIGLSLFVRTIKRWISGYQGNQHRDNPMFQSLLQDFYSSIDSGENHQTVATTSNVKFSEEEPFHLSSEEDVDLKIHKDVTRRTVLHPQHISEQIDDKTPEDIENERVVLSDYEYADNLYREIADFTKRKVDQQIKSVDTSKKSTNNITKKKRSSIPKVTALTGTGGVIQPATDDVLTTDATTTELPKKPQRSTIRKVSIPAASTTTNRNVKVFGSRRNNL
jgi:hypothetical protein